ncbi:hypothetical protein T439DRAFT_327521 [Meredithblackwellia eburnea MCA 4105]
MAESALERREITIETLPPSHVIPYSIHSCSGYTAAYVPTHILVDNPEEQSSRWTGAAEATGAELGDGYPKSNPTPGTSTPVGAGASGAGAGRRRRDIQYITLELETPALITSVGFGKYMKQHPCNVSELAIYGGMSPNKRYMERIHHGGLKNDSIKERFAMDIGKPEGRELPKGSPAILPIKYIRIDAMNAHSQNYNVSIWHVWLEGVTDPVIVNQVVADYEEARSRATSHLILSHLRRSFLLPAFDSLRASLPLAVTTSFEHPLLTTLHTALVLKGLFSGPPGAEGILEQALEQGLFDEWGKLGKKGKSVARWERINGETGFAHPLSASMTIDGDAPSKPPGRGGHQMVRVGRKILLYGGWDGGNLGDMWECDLPRSSQGSEGVGPWRLVDQKGWGPEGRLPSPRSCHQFVVDESDGWVYLLGGLDARGDSIGGEPDRRAPSPASTVLPSPFSAPSPDPSAASHPPEGPPNIPRTARTNGNSNGNLDSTPAGAMEVEEDGLRVPHAHPPMSRSSSRSLNPLASDFWRFKAVGPDQGRWELLCEDVSAEGGPKILFDHQMVINSTGQMLFVFGGKALDTKASGEGLATEYIGMYCYNIRSKRWIYLFGDPTATDTFRSERLLSRTGHGMLYDPLLHTLFVFAGSRADEYLSDLWAIRLATAEDEDDDPPREPEYWRAGAVLPNPNPATTTSSSISPTPILLSTKSLSTNYSNEGGPPAAFTQRAVIDVGTGEWTLLSGLRIDPKVRDETPESQIWTRSREGAWENVEVKGDQPPGRFGGQVVYDPLRKDVYMFGGNPHQEFGATRLDDFWRLRIYRSTPEEALRKTRFLIRKQKFTEMCQTQPTLAALTYLQTTLSSVVDHTDEDEASAFRACMAALLAAPSNSSGEGEVLDDSEMGSSPSCSSSSQDGDGDEEVEGMNESMLSSQTSAVLAMKEGETTLTSELYEHRHRLFEELLDFFPDCERQPREDLRDMAQSRRDEVVRGRFG